MSRTKISLTESKIDINQYSQIYIWRQMSAAYAYHKMTFSLIFGDAIVEPIVQRLFHVLINER